MESSLSSEKLQNYLECISELKSKSWSTVKEFQKAIGKLQWACTVVLPGRPFLRHLIFAISGKVNPCHHTSITAGIREDLDVWITFLINYNGRTLFLSDHRYQSPTIHLFRRV